MIALLIRVGLLTVATCAVFAAPATISAQQAAPLSASAGVSEAASPAPAPVKRKRNAQMITADEIREANANTAYEAVSRLRPGWLRKRGVSSLNREGTILVYQDGMRFGGPGSLQQINANAIESIRFLDGSAATQRFGTDHGNGAILVTSRR